MVFHIAINGVLYSAKSRALVGSSEQFVYIHNNANTNVDFNLKTNNYFNILNSII